MTPLKFGQLLSSRLCHDLIAPAGAIGSGLEILREASAQSNTSDILALIEQSAEMLSKKLVFYRAAFGSSSAAQLGSVEDIDHLLDTFLKTTKIEFLFQADRTQTLSDNYPDWGRLMAHLVLLLVEVAPRGGLLTITWTPSLLNFHLKGHLVALRDTHRNALLGTLDPASLTPHEIQPYIAFLLMQSLGITFAAVETSQEEVFLSITSSV